MRTVGEVARLAGVTVRAGLHHCDEIGLLKPSGRSESGYRLYSYDDLLRLQEIVGWQQLGFSLKDVQALLDRPGYDRGAALRRQRALAEEQRDRFTAMLGALDEALAANLEGRLLKEDTMFEGFDTSAYADEAERRWGDTTQYQESQRRVSGYGAEEWKQVAAEARDIEDAFAACLADGCAPTNARAVAVAERHRQHISRWFYECTPEIHRGLGEMYVADERFRANWDKRCEGLAEYVRSVLVAKSESAE